MKPYQAKLKAWAARRKLVRVMLKTMTQRQAAAKLGISQQRVCQLAKGE